MEDKEKAVTYLTLVICSMLISIPLQQLADLPEQCKQYQLHVRYCLTAFVYKPISWRCSYNLKVK